PLFPVLHCPLGLGELQACPFSGVFFPPLPLSALSFYPFPFALQDGFGLLDLGTDFLAGNMVFVGGA
ncbi:hypothetical protein, partial [Thiolapillus sp.]|uniref:hypothetical protein n=1 Tax=Thiolapillus sp. TaxID=2017437 RepID=UPI003AF6EC6A